MSFQTLESISFNKKKYVTNAYPFDHYLLSLDQFPSFVAEDTSLNKGYIASWAVEDNRLYLLDLRAFIQDSSSLPREVDVSFFFNTGQTKIFSNWYTGSLILGKLENFKKQEKYILTLKSGVVLDVQAL